MSPDIGSNSICYILNTVAVQYLIELGWCNGTNDLVCLEYQMGKVYTFGTITNTQSI
jgi:hypothetical protein